MKLQEFCEVINRKESTILRHWKQTQENLAKKGVIITKAGTGKTAEYFVEYKPM